ncbi:MAG TPA: helix-turn-helix domain-containing protein [Chitinophagaceae bacterium]|nr:helix-turn-helix domain-containing protein [Chitinophagaceae bacterium]
MEKHDKEVSCIGYIFYGTANITTILLDQREQKKFEILFEMIVEEFQTKDNIQGEMLTILLKRLIIKCTRLARTQQYGDTPENATHSIIRQFNILVEINFKTEHAVNFYAKQLNIAAKSLTNIFSTAKLPNPLTVIHNRLLTEARRQILFSDKPIKEIAYELNFTDIQSFSRFFKSKQGVSPINFKKSKIDNY